MNIAESIKTVFLLMLLCAAVTTETAWSYYSPLKINKKNNLWVDVKNFGAKGDGLTDDSASIQNAINSIKETGGTIFCQQATIWHMTSPCIQICDLQALQTAAVY